MGKKTDKLLLLPSSDGKTDYVIVGPNGKAKQNYALRFWEQTGDELFGDPFGLVNYFFFRGGSAA